MSDPLDKVRERAPWPVESPHELIRDRRYLSLGVAVLVLVAGLLTTRPYGAGRASYTVASARGFYRVLDVAMKKSANHPTRSTELTDYRLRAGDLATALGQNYAIDSWSVSRQHNRLVVDSATITWVTGPQGGGGACYFLSLGTQLYGDRAPEVAYSTPTLASCGPHDRGVTSG